MGYFSDLDLQIRTYISDPYYYRHVGRCKKCKTLLRVVGFTAPRTFRVSCSNHRCTEQGEEFEVQYKFTPQPQ